MRWKARLRAGLGWFIVVAAVALTLAMIASAFGSIDFDTSARASGGSNYIGIDHGSLFVGGDDLPARTSKNLTQYRFSWDWWPLWEYYSVPDMGWSFRLTLWPIWLALAAPTGWWAYNRLRNKPGHCRCGYDLTGLVKGVCPECGRAVVSPVTDAGTDGR